MTAARAAASTSAADRFETALPLAATGLRKHFGLSPALDDVDFTLEPGQVLGLIGRNGAGKSTLIRCLLGLSAPDAGEARVWGTPALFLDDAAKARLGYVPQLPEAMGWMNVDQALGFVAQFYPHWDREYVHEARSRMRIPPATPLSRLSPGERQSVAIIRALAPRPALLVMDEPAAALDPVARRALLREIAERAAETECSVLFSTHIVSDLERVASHVAFMHEGRILLHRELDALKECHLRLHVPAALAAGVSETQPGEIARRVQDGGGLRIVLLHTPGQALPEALQHPDIRGDRLSLEDLFVEVAG